MSKRNGQTNNTRIDADPSKSFFIDMLTRDIGVVDCILDLIDNAIDRAVERSGVNVMNIIDSVAKTKKIAGANISITFSSERFEITDTCGGISIDEARHQVFRFGNPDERGAPHGLSVYGIGMKRAFFKLGEAIHVHSETASEYFEVDIDVLEWKSRSDQWWFEFAQFGEVTSSAPGTSISISELREGIGERFAMPTFKTELSGRISSTYALFIDAGVSITLNGTKVTSKVPKIVADPFQPVRRKFRTDGVDTLLIASVSARTDRSAHGWYVFCNGRMVLEADKTNLTGWGEGLPAFHNKYNHFLGLVYFESTDVRKLPWRTTKQGVEKESPVYQAALMEMKLQARPILTFLNEMYPTELELRGVEERELLDRAQVVSLSQLSKAETSFQAPPRPRKKSATVSIQYSRPREMIERIAEYLEDTNMAASRIGEYTFDYFVANELE